MLRLAMRIKNVDAAASNEWANKAITGGTMSSGSDTAFMSHTSGPQQLNSECLGSISTKIC